MILGLDKQTAGDSLRLVIFVVVTTLATALLVVTIGNISFGGKKTYKAVFSEATGVVKGDDIRVAGVKVGSVQGVEIFKDTQAIVEFEVLDGTEITGSTQAQIRYRNLVGQRYISLNEGQGSGQQLRENGTIPVSNTQPALDLTVLFNGFKPLFAAISPDDVNQLATQLIQVFQGEGGTLEGLLQRTASVTNTLASRDRLISDLIANLNEALVTVGDRDQELSELLIQFRRFVSGLKNDRQAILGSLDSISALSVETADLVTGIRPGLRRDIKGLRGVAGTIVANRAEVDRALKVLPVKVEKIGRTAIYGSFFNFYLCDLTATVDLPGDQLLGGLSQPLSPITYANPSARCDIG
jgi:phospholipid/cholesterol/gamma-HCH transport system substrate-binding protein